MRAMAIIERFTISSSTIGTFEEPASADVFPGLRISVRATTSSLTDYPEWRLEDLGKNTYESVVSDGACS